jgi:hypothetical protein
MHDQENQKDPDRVLLDGISEFVHEDRLGDRRSETISQGL